MSTKVKVLFVEGKDDYALRIDNLHTVDVGPCFIMEADHLTRDGQPMEVRWSSDLGFLVAVQSH